MTSKHRVRVGSMAVIVLGYLVGIAAYPNIPGILLTNFFITLKPFSLLAKKYL